MTVAAEAASARPRPLRALVSALIVFLVLVLATAALKGFRDLERARDRESSLAADVGAAEARIEEARRRIDRLREDPVTLDRVARESLGLAAPDEVLIVVPPPPARP